MKKLSAILLSAVITGGGGVVFADDQPAGQSSQAGKTAVTPSATGTDYAKQLKTPKHKATMKKEEAAGKKGVYPEGKDQAQETMELKKNDQMRKKAGGDSASTTDKPQPK